MPLPTWNRILAMNPWVRKRLRDFLHHAVFISIQYGSEWPTSTVYQGKPYRTDLFMLEYYQMIRPNKSRKLAIANLKASLK